MRRRPRRRVTRDRRRGSAGAARSKGPANRSQARVARCRHRRAWLGARGQPPEAGRLLRSRGAGRGADAAGASARGAARAGAGARHAAAATAAGQRLHQFRPRLLRYQRRCRQLPRVQYLRRRERAAAASDHLGRLSWRPGRRVGVGPSALHVGRTDARAARLRPARGQRYREQGALPRYPDLRHHRHPQAASGRGGADVPWIAHPHPGAGPEEPEPHLRLRLRHGHGAARARSSRAARGRTPRRTRTPRSSASTSSKSRSARRRTRRS